MAKEPGLRPLAAVCEQGRGLPFDEDLAKKILTESEVEINIQMAEGDGVCTCWGCDITYDSAWSWPG